MNLLSIVSLLQVALGLLVSSAGTPQQPQAILFAKSAVSLAQQALVQQVSVQPTGSVPIIQGQTAETPVGSPTETQMETIEIFSPFIGKGINDPHKVLNGEEKDENIVQVGLFVKDADGKYRRDAVVEVSDSEGNHKTLNGTGTQVKTDDGFQPYYDWSHTFTRAGTYSVTFTYGGITKTATMVVSE